MKVSWMLHELIWLWDTRESRTLLWGLLLSYNPPAEEAITAWKRFSADKTVGAVVSFW